VKSRYKYSYGIKKGLPIALGYLSVAFGFGISAVGKGLSGIEAILISMTTLTSAGQIAGVGIISAGGSFIEMAITQLVINIRYCLMGLALTQKLDITMTTPNRLMASYGITDEVFAVSISERECIGNKYMYGLITLPYIGWALGTALGAFAGHVLPQAICLALGIAIYSMFVAIIIPPAKENKGIMWCVIISAVMSCIFYYTPCLKTISQGFSIIICAVVPSVLMAILKPVKEEENE
jgi:predicted branched-subunit amino acid permease